MTADEVWCRIKATPFRPFTITTDDGLRIPVVDRWQALVTPSGREVVVCMADDEFKHIELHAIAGVTDGVSVASV